MNTDTVFGLAIVCLSLTISILLVVQCRRTIEWIHRNKPTSLRQILRKQSNGR